MLVVADGADTTADLICTELASRPVRVFRFDTAEFPAQVALDAVLDENGGWRGALTRPDGGSVELGQVRSVL